MLLLALDTATPAVTVALHDGGSVIAEAGVIDARHPGELLAAVIQKALADAGAVPADLTGVVAGTGPGPYTGLRAGLVTARVLGSTLGIAAHGLCTLDVIAADAARATGGPFLVAADARRREVYWASYRAAGQRDGEPRVSPPAELPGGLPVAGEGPCLYPDVLGEPLAPRFPSAATLAGLAAARLLAGAALGPAEPLYLRLPDARVPGPPKPVSPQPAGGRQ